MSNNRDNKKSFNIYVFLTTFARNLIEVFVGAILLKNGYSLHYVFFYFLLVNVFSFVLGFPCAILSKKYSNKILSVVGIISFILLQIILNFINGDVIYLYLIAFLFALYRRGYWISRRYYTLQVIDDNKNISKMYSIISIINQLGVVLSTYIGSLLLQFLNINVITILSIILLIVSLYFIFKLKFNFEDNNTRIKLFDTIRCIPKSSIFHIACYELQNIIKFLLPIYLIVYVKDTYTTIGIVSLIANIATLIFTYMYGRLINKDKSYLKLSIMLVIVIKVLQINTTGIILMIISFMEGFVFKMYDQSFNKLSLMLSKNYEYHNYNFMYETIQNISRLIVFIIIFIFISDVRNMIYFILFIISLCLLVEFRVKPTDMNSEVIWKEK